MAISLLLVLLFGRSHAAVLTQEAHRVWPVLLVALAAAAAYIPVLSMPLVTDDYIHIQQISTGQAPTPLECLTNSCGGPRFFRPLGFSVYWAEWEMWGTAAFPRHALDVVLHVALSVLFLRLTRLLAIPPPLDWLAGLLFALNGIGPESVAWPAARFDTLAILFSLIAALAVRGGGRWSLPVSLVATAAACLSKESAYVLPLLLGLLCGKALLTRAGKVLTGCNFAIALAVFAWRWAVLKGIGGYQEQSGVPTVFEFDLLKLAKTFLSRIWGVLWFPINWSRPLEPWMLLGLIAGVAGSLMLWRAKPERARLWLCAIGVVVACLPAHHMLLIGPSLERSRYLTYAMPAFVLLLTVACAGLPRRSGALTMALLVLFHLAALEHNLHIWSTVASARYNFCRSTAERAVNSTSPIETGPLPLTVDGVYWRNGLEDCMVLEFGVPMGKVHVDVAGQSAR